MVLQSVDERLFGPGFSHKTRFSSHRRIASHRQENVASQWGDLGVSVLTLSIILLPTAGEKTDEASL